MFTWSVWAPSIGCFKTSNTDSFAKKNRAKGRLVSSYKYLATKQGDLGVHELMTLLERCSLATALFVRAAGAGRGALKSDLRTQPNRDQKGPLFNRCKREARHWAFFQRHPCLPEPSIIACGAPG